MPETHSKLAVALAEVVVDALPDSGDSNEHKQKLVSQAIDARLTEIRKHYDPEELARCPIVTHHREGPCADCNTAAMRAFILLPEQL